MTACEVLTPPLLDVSASGSNFSYDQVKYYRDAKELLYFKVLKKFI